MKNTPITIRRLPMRYFLQGNSTPHILTKTKVPLLYVITFSCGGLKLKLKWANHRLVGGSTDLQTRGTWIGKCRCSAESSQGMPSNNHYCYEIE